MLGKGLAMWSVGRALGSLLSRVDMIMEAGGFAEGHGKSRPAQSSIGANSLRSWYVQELLCSGGKIGVEVGEGGGRLGRVIYLRSLPVPKLWDPNLNLPCQQLEKLV